MLGMGVALFVNLRSSSSLSSLIGRLSARFAAFARKSRVQARRIRVQHMAALIKK